MTPDLDEYCKNVGAFPAEEKSQSLKSISVHFTYFPEAWQVCVCVCECVSVCVCVSVALSWVACIWSKLLGNVLSLWQRWTVVVLEESWLGGGAARRA